MTPKSRGQKPGTFNSGTFDWGGALRRLHAAEDAIDNAISRSGDDLKDLFDRRAKALAEPLGEIHESAESEFLVVRCGVHRCGIPLRYLAEAVAEAKIATAPGTPSGILGLIQVRGEIRVVWRLDELLGTATAAPDTWTVLLVRQGAAEAGLAVAETEDIREIDEAGVKPGTGDHLHSRGTTGDSISILNMETLLAAMAAGNQ